MKGNLVNNRFLNQPLSSVFNNGFQYKFFSEDPTFLAFSISFDLNSPLFNPATTTYYESAERFFLNQDDQIRAGYIVDLRDRVKQLMFDHQHFLQSISGLNQIYSKIEGEIKEKIEILTLESLDMRITKIKELYNRVTYDYKNNKEILPDNLKRFNVDIVVGDFRKLAKWINNDFVDITPSIDTLCFSIKRTMFLTDEGHSYLETLSNSEIEMAENSLAFIGGKGFIENSRIALNEILTNEIDEINAIKTNTGNSGEDFNLKNGIEAIDKSKISPNVIETKNIPQSEITDKTLPPAIKDNKQDFLDGVLKNVGNKLISDIGNGVQQQANGLISQGISDILKKTGIADVNNPINQFLAGKSFFDLLKEAIDGSSSSSASSLSIDFEANEGLAQKILNDEALTFEDKTALYQILIKKMLES